MLRGQRKPGQKWLPRDGALATALTQYEAMLCSGCGQPMHESMDYESDGEWSAPNPTRCHACTAIGHRVEQWQKLENVPVPSALRFHAERRPRRGPAADRGPVAPR